MQLIFFSTIFMQVSMVNASKVTFEDLYLPSETYWNGAENSYGFISESVSFSNNYNAIWNSWDGFAYSNLTDTTITGITGQYNAITGMGYSDSANYAICSVGYITLPVITFEKSVYIGGLYITNCNYAYYSMLNGDMFSKKFGGFSGNDPDWFKLTITGKDINDVETGTVDFYLADYRFEDNNLDYIINMWQYVNLTSLGVIKTLELNLSSSDTGDWGMNTPAYFALDTLIFRSDSTYIEPYNEAGINGYINPYNHGRHASTNDPNAVVNPVFRGWATEVVDYYQTPGVDFRWHDPNKTLGQVTGNVNDIFSLGDLSREQINQGDSPGWITLSFDEPIQDNNGYDFVVFENGLLSEFTTSNGSITGEILAELAYVEVSSDGEDFARFPAVSLTDQPGNIFSTINMNKVYNLAGKHPNAYNICTGTPFDLKEIAELQTVKSGLVDINDIRYVRLVDIPGTGDFYDGAVKHIDPNTWPAWEFYENNHPIYDAWNTSLVPQYPSGGFDLEAIGVLKEQKYCADIDLNGVVDTFDFVLFASSWHRYFGEPGWIARCDLSESDDLFIDTQDLAVFASQWLLEEQWKIPVEE